MLALSLVEEIGLIAGAAILVLVFLFLLRPLKVHVTVDHAKKKVDPSDASDTIPEDKED